MKPEFWHERWRSGKIGFHQGAPEPLLIEFFPKSGAREKVFVPLCGKSLDLVWLAGQGHEVVGVELSPVACESFFRENLPGEELERRTEGTLTRFRAGPYTLFCGDYFDLAPAQLPGVTVAYDRAALIAMEPPELRERYAAHFKRLHPHGPVLLLTLEFPQEKMEGPPFSIGPAEVRRLYGDSFEVEHRAGRDAPGHFADHPGLAGEKILEHAFWLKPRG